MQVVRWDRSAYRFSGEKLQKVGLFSSENFFLDLYCLEPGQFQKAHAHERSDKVYLVLEGSARIRVGDEQCTLGPGEAVRAAPGEVHGVTNDSAGNLVLVVLMAPSPA